MKAINSTEFNKKKITDSKIIERILDGEKELYELLVRRNNQKLYRVIRSYLKNEADVEDIMQDSYLKAYTKLYQFKRESSFSTWLIRIGINESLAKLKEKGTTNSVNENLNDFKNNSILEIPDNRQLNPQEEIIQKEIKELLENAIDQLDVKYRTVYILKEVEGMHLDEIARILDLTVSNVKVRLYRAKTMLKGDLYELSIDKNVFEFGYTRCDLITEKVMSLLSESPRF